MSLPGSSTPPAPDSRRDDFAYASGQAVVRLLELGIRPRQIMTKEAFENAIAVVMALGGSTNAVLHLLAIAAEARVELALEDFNKVAARVPHIADTKPHGKYHMVDLDRIGGVPMVMQHLLDAGLLHGDCLTVTGKTVAENLADLAPPAPDGAVVHPLSDPLHAVGGIAVLKGSLAPKGAVVKVAGIDHLQFEGRARVFDGEDAAMAAVLGEQIEAGDIVVIRYEGPKGGPGMREMLAITGAMKGVGRGGDAALDHRRPLLRRHARLLHRPRRAGGGRRRAHRLRGGGRPHPHRRRRPHHRPAGRRGHPGQAARELEAPGAALHERGAGEVRPARVRRRARRHHRGLSESTTANTTRVAPADSRSAEPQRRQPQLDAASGATSGRAVRPSHRSSMARHQRRRAAQGEEGGDDGRRRRVLVLDRGPNGSARRTASFGARRR